MPQEPPKRYIFDLLAATHRGLFRCMFRLYLAEQRKESSATDLKNLFISTFCKEMPRDEFAQLLECSHYLADQITGTRYHVLISYGLGDFIPTSEQILVQQDAVK